MMPENKTFYEKIKTGIPVILFTITICGLIVGGMYRFWSVERGVSDNTTGIGNNIGHISKIGQAQVNLNEQVIKQIHDQELRLIRIEERHKMSKEK